MCRVEYKECTETRALSGFCLNRLSREGGRDLYRGSLFTGSPGYRCGQGIRHPKLEGFTDKIGQWLLEDLERSRKQFHTVQSDFDKAVIVLSGVEQKIHFFAFDLSHSDACHIRAYHAATSEAWMDGPIHVSALIARLHGACNSALARKATEADVVITNTLPPPPILRKAAEPGNHQLAAW